MNIYNYNKLSFFLFFKKSFLLFLSLSLSPFLLFCFLFFSFSLSLFFSFLKKLLFPLSFILPAVINRNRLDIIYGGYVKVSGKKLELGIISYPRSV